MRIVFLCGSLEPGRDGVGDYVRRLSSELLMQGHEVKAIALNDRYVTEIISVVQDEDGLEIPVLRLPAKLKQNQQTKIAKKYIDDFKPDVISLQFVPYSFHRKGIPFNIISRIKPLIQRAKLHVMFHEIWLDKPNGHLQKLVALFQKVVIYRFLKKLKPYSINVTLPFNQKRLKNLGIRTGILNLFGNIYPGKFYELPIELRSAVTSNFPAILYFGTPPTGDFLIELADDLASFCKKTPGGMKIIVASGTSKAKDLFCDTLRSKLSVYNCVIVDCGFLQAEFVSMLMSKCTIGISRSDIHLVGKSGSAISMLEHGLPVWIPKWDGVEAFSYNFRKDLLFSNIDSALSAIKSYQYHNMVRVVAENFVNQFIMVKDDIN